jgi:hypothetical protein
LDVADIVDPEDLFRPGVAQRRQLAARSLEVAGRNQQVDVPIAAVLVLGVKKAGQRGALEHHRPQTGHLKGIKGLGRGRVDLVPAGAYS